MNNKLISLHEAAQLVEPGDLLALGGMTLYRRPVAFAIELARRYLKSGEPNGLTLFAFTAGYESDLLVGSGMIESVRSCYFGLEIFGLAPMFTYLANRGELEILEETEASLAFGLRAQMAGISFMPGRGWIGTDLPNLRPDVRTITDPYNGEELMAFPAIKPDVAVIHALRADQDGNAQIGKNKGVDEELCLTAEKVIVTAEEIVPELTQADLVAPLVKAVVHTPRGAAPTSCHPLYPLDGEAIMAYTEQVSDPESWRAYFEGIK
ncbi:MAG: CoA transferase subunit A [Anaerolineales bacterium]|nr:CoA transferase subunit A [Chloroflexota bacterium]MBL6982694.1 CoA transferase subunit A [Anaerolineales bacterium]